MALPSSYRIKKGAEIQELFEKGKTVGGDFLFVKFLKNNLGYPRFVVVVSSKTAGKAVKRNLVRRRAYESLKKFQSQKIPFDFLIVTNSRILNKSFKEINRKIDEVMNTIISQVKTSEQFLNYEKSNF